MTSSNDNPFDFHNYVVSRISSAKTFEERLQARTDVGYERFGPTAKQIGLRLLERGNRLDLPEYPNALVLGVATYSNPEMTLLNQCFRYLRDRADSFIFDIDVVLNYDDLQLVMPGASLFKKTPVLAEYDAGTLIQVTEGNVAMSRLAELVKS